MNCTSIVIMANRKLMFHPIHSIRRSTSSLKILPKGNNHYFCIPSLDFSIPHKLTQEEALKRIKHLLSDAKRDHSDKIDKLEEHWEGNKGTFSFSAKGYDISG